MRFVKLVCPHCGANLEIEDGRNKCFCSYCGGAVFIDDEVKRSEHRETVTFRDEARLRELDLQEEARLRQEARERALEEEKRRRRRRWVWSLITTAFIWCVFFIVAISMAKAGHTVAERFSMPVAYLFVFFPVTHTFFFPYKQSWSVWKKIGLWILLAYATFWVFYGGAELVLQILGITFE